MGGYNESLGFLRFCFLPVPVAMENTVALDDVIDGWRVLGFSALALWMPDMKQRLQAARTDERKLQLYQRVKDKPNAEAARMYKGGSFQQNLPSSHVAKEKPCCNPKCNTVEIKAKSCATGHVLKSEMRLSKCVKCERATYCSRECQKSDWNRHKKSCNKKSNKSHTEY